MTSKGMRYIAGFVVVLLFAASACVPMVSPPLRVAGGGGVQIRDIDTQSTTGGGGRVQVAIHPLRFIPELFQRRFDAGLGYTAHFVGSEEVHHAIYGSALVYPWSTPGSQDMSMCRLELGIVGKAVRGLHTWGGGGGFELRWSYSRFVLAEDVSGPRIVGVGWGEGGFGAGISIEVYQVDERLFGLLSFELHADLPAFAGIIFLE